MQHHYYIENNGKKEGPHDLVTIMRRIRVGKITADTLIYIDDEETGQAASAIEDIALFFDHVPQSQSEIYVKPRKSLSALLVAGWQFTLEYNIMTVYSGALLLIAIALAAAFVTVLGPVAGGLMAWGLFMMLHNTYLVFVLRLHRGQTLGSNFINHQLSPAINGILWLSLVLALMMIGGTLLLVIPGLLITTFYIFAPLLMLDHRYSTVESMHASRLLLKKHRWKYFGTALMLVISHISCLILILPVPLTLPIFAAALSDLYEEISAS